MKPSKIALSCASLFVPSFLMLQAAPAHAATTLEQEATGTISELQGQAAALADHADEFRQIIGTNESSWHSQVVELDTLKNDINIMGKELKTLEAERESLAPWQIQAIDRAEPLLKDAAANTDQAIDYFNENRAHLWASEYRGYVRNIRSDSEQVSHALKNYVALAKVRDREQRLKNTVDTTASAGQATSEGSLGARGQ